MLRPMQTYAGSCHGGVVRFETDSDMPELTTCDCSICRRRNASMVRVHQSCFRLHDFDPEGLPVHRAVGAAMP